MENSERSNKLKATSVFKEITDGGERLPSPNPQSCCPHPLDDSDLGCGDCTSENCAVCVADSIKQLHRTVRISRLKRRITQIIEAGFKWQLRLKLKQLHKWWCCSNFGRWLIK